ncbi:hypothetical protein EMIHUDRAFT_198946 [Emiliania huxleyi CCMP1516]|uniref:Phytanoyl-CoA dioxygenase n=2 Tax=Emiliania huxleyi TaxID=2903 RepID=A0A0D3I217_EMIH1|nr:hypothetical protein EMIHUDRAFT_198946 [Emiliania huxleyi CCMP1516]EOD05302.1 hypothetical protein EMIHUDRAFT_198946 [Emiliania huxleyi CCMP1516]|eukprot:XP_005757731.1 hypothetical protein EMIHUDRAFT_198946 [Emiliania huxleyi CCMP1516]
MQASGLEAERNKATARRGVMERSFLQPGTALVALEQKRAANPIGFGAKAAAAQVKKKKKTRTKGSRARPLSALATELKASGVVRIDGALSPALVEELREFVDAERVQATADVKAGRCDQKARFADLVLLDKRCDLLLPLHGPPIAALQELLGEGSVLGPLLQEVVGEAGVLQELACLTSEPGSAQQPLHPDTPWTPIPSAYTAFIALQDVDAHTSFFGGDLSLGNAGVRRPPIPEEFLRSREVKLGLLKAGDLALYNQQTLHCGSANESRDKDELAALNGRRTRVDEGGGRGLFGKLDEVDALEVRDTEGAVQIRFGDEGSQLGSEYEII